MTTREIVVIVGSILLCIGELMIGHYFRKKNPKK